MDIERSNVVELTVERVSSMPRTLNEESEELGECAWVVAESLRHSRL
jgi:hypothetical protein